MLDGVILLWFVLSAISVVFVAVDIRTTPEAPVLKWGFVLLAVYTGVVGAFLYVLGCREPLPGLHERYVAVRWRQVLGSTMHCVAGDGVGILVGAVLSRLFGLSGLPEIVLEYVLGFGFGWSIFQALFMRDMMGGSYSAALRGTFMAEFLSMNLLMTGMVPTVMILRHAIAGASDPASPRFWFVLSIGLLVGFVFSYPINWWLVSNHLKHGMMTIRPGGPKAAAAPAGDGAMAGMEAPAVAPETAGMPGMAVAPAPMPGMAAAAMPGVTHGASAAAPSAHTETEGKPATALSPPLPVMAALTIAALVVGVGLGLLVGA